jgi:hypothetical protein
LFPPFRQSEIKTKDKPMEISFEERQELIDTLEAYAAAGGVAPVKPYFIDGDFDVTFPDGRRLNSEELIECCKECAVDVVDKVGPYLAEDAERLYVGDADLWGCSSPESCDACGAVLDYHLDAHGVRAELQHFEANAIGTPLTPYEAFTIARMVEGLAEAPEKQDLATRVLALAEQALSRDAGARAGGKPQLRTDRDGRRQDHRSRSTGADEGAVPVVPRPRRGFRRRSGGGACQPFGGPVEGFLAPALRQRAILL